MIGFRVELKYPNQRKKLKTYPLIQSPHKGLTRAMIKKGNQQIIKAPVTIASVFAAFFSLFSSNEICFFFSFSFFGFRFSFGVVNRALSSVWHPVLECLIGPFLQSVFRWLPGLCHTINNRRIRSILYLPMLGTCVTLWPILTLWCWIVWTFLEFN